jgi:hypothetical protein
VTEKKGGSARRALQRGGGRAQRGGETPAIGPETGGRDTGGAERTKRATKRITVDLPRGEHRFLRDFAYENDTDGMRVVRALLLELKHDPDLSSRVLGRMGEL